MAANEEKKPSARVEDPSAEELLNTLEELRNFTREKITPEIFAQLGINRSAKINDGNDQGRSM